MGEKYLILNGDQPIAVLHEEGYTRDANHKYLIFDKNPPAGFISQGAFILTQQYLKQINQPLKKWKTDNKLYSYIWREPKTQKEIKTKNFNYKIIAEELRAKGAFDAKKFNLPLISSGWLDRSLDLSMNFHFIDLTGKVMKLADGTLPEEYGESFPLKPILDREGHIFTSFQTQLIRRIIKQRTYLIENSNLALKYDWIFELRGLINDSISLVDITLNQLYNKAEFNPEKTWKFDKLKLGSKNARRIKDKLKWVRQISGNNLDIEPEYPMFDNLRKIRNHFNHFDPPTLVITLEEAAEWLNQILYIGQILIKIRNALGTPISTSIIELISQKQAIFNPEAAFIKRVALNSKEAGYQTSIWKEEEI